MEHTGRASAVVAEGHALEDFDLVVDAFQQTRVQRVATVCQDAGEPRFQVVGEGLQRFDAAANGPLIPPLEEASRSAGIGVVPQVLEVIFEDVDGGQPSVGCQQLVEPHPILGCDIFAVSQKQPARPLDEPARGAILADPMGFVHSNAVDHLPAVLGDDMEEVVDDRRL